MSSGYEAVIGLEVHAELLTRTKIFCDSAAHFGGEPNTHVCPVCLGLPGVLPVLNEAVVELALRAALALGCEVQPFSKFDRKNYFYPDLPKAYQISQYDQPIALGGQLTIFPGGERLEVRLTRIHMEEDAGKLVHAGAARLAGSDYSLADYNRAGVPLIEIVGEPELRTPEQARLYLEELRNILVYAGVCDGKMEEGSLRCDANVSVRPAGSDKLGTRCEIKNLNSFRSLERAVDYEIRRQIDLVETGERVVMETRLWDEQRQATFSMRSKEEAHDYRYFPEPDLVPLQISPAWIERVRQALPELPQAKRGRYVATLGLTEYDAGVLVNDLGLVRYFEATLAHFPKGKLAANWLLSDVQGLLKARSKAIDETAMNPAYFAELLQLVDSGAINGKTAKELLPELLDEGQSPKALVDQRGLGQISDPEAIKAMVREVLAQNQPMVEQYRSGKEAVAKNLIGKVMGATKGRANAQLVNDQVMAELKAATT